MKVRGKNASDKDERFVDYLFFFKGLADKNIDYLLVGGLAVNFHGIPRMTYDIDIMILLEEENVKGLIDQFQDWGYRPRIPENPILLADEKKRKVWSEEKAMKAFTFWNDQAVLKEVDVVFDSPIDYKELKRRAIKIRVQDIEVPVISIHDLIKMKDKSERQQDLSDAEQLKELLKE